MIGFTTENGKFLMPLEEKFSYDDAVTRCDSFGFKANYLSEGQIIG